jgi:predicted PurR-regulated permease PerM
MKPLPAVVYREHALGPTSSQTIAYGLIIFLGLCAILYFGRDILIPVALAVLLSILLAPVVRGLQRIRFPKAVAVLITVVLAFSIVAVISGLVASTLTNLAADLPRYESSLREKAQNLKSMTTGGGTLERAANVLKDLRAELEVTPPEAAATEPEAKPIPVEVHEAVGPFDSILTVLGVLVHPMTQFGIVVLMVCFILIYREDLRDRMIRLAGTSDIHRTTTAMDEAGKRLSRLFATQLAINAATGVIIGAALFLLGIPGALLWGVLVTVLRFIPYVGTFLTSVFPIIIAVAVGKDWTLALLTLVTVVGVETVVGQVLEPLFFGKSTGVSPVAVVAAAAFWTAIWGPIGLILATPITIVLLVVGRHIESLQFLDVLLGAEPVLTPEHAFYQRMLANDPVEAAEHATLFEEKGQLAQYLSEVAIPGLLLAQRDRDRKVLMPDREVNIVTAYSDLLEELWPDADTKADEASSVIVVSAHGALNFAAALSVSALLRLKGVPHRLLAEDAIQPGKFPDEAAKGADTVCLCYLVAPSQAKYSYLERRLKARLPEAKVIGLAWAQSEGAREMINPEHAVTMLPQKVSAKTEAAAAPAPKPALRLSPTGS